MPTSKDSIYRWCEDGITHSSQDLPARTAQGLQDFLPIELVRGSHCYLKAKLVSTGRPYCGPVPDQWRHVINGETAPNPAERGVAVPVGYTIELVLFGIIYLLWTSEGGTAGGPAYHAQRQLRRPDGSLQPVGTQLTASRIQPKRGRGSPACGSTSRLLTAAVADANAARGAANDKTKVSGPYAFGWQVEQFDAMRALLNSSMQPQWAPEAALPRAAVPQATAAREAPAAQPMPPSVEQVLAQRLTAPTAGDTLAGVPPAREAAMQIGSAERPPQSAGSMRRAAQRARRQADLPTVTDLAAFVVQQQAEAEAAAACERQPGSGNTPSVPGGAVGGCGPHGDSSGVRTGAASCPRSSNRAQALRDCDASTASFLDVAASLLTLGNQPADSVATHQRQAAPSIAEVHAALAVAPALAKQWAVGADAASLALRCMRGDTVERLLRIAPDGQWQVCIVQQQLSSSLIAARMPERIHSVAQLQAALRVVGSLHICTGNCSPRFQPVMQSRRNEAIFAAGDAGQPTARVFRDSFRSGGKLIDWTVRAVAAEQRTGCQLVKLPSHSNKAATGMCRECQVVGDTLRKACQRFQRPQQPRRRQLKRLAEWAAGT